MSKVKPKVLYHDWTKMPYAEGWDKQTEFHNQLKENKISRRRAGLEQNCNEIIHHLIFAEHPHVYTLGKSGKEDHLLIGSEELAEKEITYFKINRGGDITYHGPGQITGYPIFDLDCFFTDVHKYVRLLEEVIIECLLTYHIEAGREDGYTGVWLPPNDQFPYKRKICAIGVHLSRWVTMHGFAFNVNTDLSFFDHIVPCGINEDDMSVTSLEQELGKKVDVSEVKYRLKRIFADLFDFEYTEK